MAALLVAIAAPTAADDRPREYDVKAAMLLNVLKFVDWPVADAAAGELRVCAVGAPEFAAALVTAARHVSRTVTVTRQRTLADVAGCQLALIGPEPGERVSAVAERLAHAGILTVSDADGHGARGVVVNFVLDGERIRFEINLDVARRGGFRISSRLLKLARVVVGGT